MCLLPLHLQMYSMCWAKSDKEMSQNLKIKKTKQNKTKEEMPKEEWKGSHDKRGEKKMCPLSKIYSQSKTSTLYSQLQGRRQTQKSAAGRWVGAEGIPADSVVRAEGSSQQSQWFCQADEAAHSPAQGLLPQSTARQCQPGQAQCPWHWPLQAVPLEQPHPVLPVPRALKPRWLCLIPILCIHSDREIKIKQFQHGTQHLTFRKMSGKSKTKCNSVATIFILGILAVLQNIHVAFLKICTGIFKMKKNSQ